MANISSQGRQFLSSAQPRNPQALCSLVRFIEEHGQLVGLEGINLTKAAESDLWAVPRYCTQRDHFGRIDGECSEIQKVTRETRTCGHEWRVVGEIDVVAAIYQIFFLEIKCIASVEEFVCDHEIVRNFVTKSSQWKHAAAACYDVEFADVEAIFTRQYARERIRPDKLAGCSRGNDALSVSSRGAACTGQGTPTYCRTIDCPSGYRAATQNSPAPRGICLS